MAELKPCKCGNKNVLLFAESGDYYVWCSMCNTVGTVRNKEWQAIDAWNKRS